MVEEGHGTRLKFYHDLSLDTEANMSHIFTPETGMPVQRLMRLFENEGGLFFQARWQGLPLTKDTLEPMKHISEDVPQPLEKLFLRQNPPASLVSKTYYAVAR